MEIDGYTLLEIRDYIDKQYSKYADPTDTPFPPADL